MPINRSLDFLSKGVGAHTQKISSTTEKFRFQKKSFFLQIS